MSILDRFRHKKTSTRPDASSSDESKTPFEAMNDQFASLVNGLQEPKLDNNKFLEILKRANVFLNSRKLTEDQILVLSGKLSEIAERRGFSTDCKSKARIGFFVTNDEPTSSSVLLDFATHVNQRPIDKSIIDTELPFNDTNAPDTATHLAFSRRTFGDFKGLLKRVLGDQRYKNFKDKFDTQIKKIIDTGETNTNINDLIKLFVDMEYFGIKPDFLLAMYLYVKNKDKKPVNFLQDCKSYSELIDAIKVQKIFLTSQGKLILATNSSEGDGILSKISKYAEAIEQDDSTTAKKTLDSIPRFQFLRIAVRNIVVKGDTLYR